MATISKNWSSQYQHDWNASGSWTTGTPTTATNAIADTTEEYKAADAYFNQEPFNENQPEELLIGRYVDASIAAVLECGEIPETDFEVWKAITDGEFNITIDGTPTAVVGLNFSAGSSSFEYFRLIII